MPKVIESIREIILQKGKEMLLEGSYGSFNIRRLAKSCGLGLGTLYNHFENKEMLVYNIFLSDWENTIELADKMKEETLPIREKLNRIYVSLETFVSQYMRVFWEMAEGRQSDCPSDRYDELHIKIKGFILAEQANGNINIDTDIDKLSYFIMTSMLNNIKSKYLTFDEMLNFIKI